MKTEWQKGLTKYFVIPQRTFMGIMGFLALGISYTLRASLSLSITEMVIKHGTKTGEGECSPSVTISTNSTIFPPKGQFEWSEELQGIILSSFFWGYICTHVPGGVLATKYGGKSILIGGILLATIANVITPVCVEAMGAPALIVLRVIIGIGQGAVFPACSVLIAAWTPISERSVMTSLVFSGAQIGNIIGTATSGLLLSSYRWPSVFYFFSGLSVIWMMCFFLLCYNDPGSHPFISEKEKNFLLKELGELERNKDLPPTPWKEILTSTPVLAMIAAQIGHNWGYFVMVADLPKYMSDVMRFSIKENGFYSALPYVVMFISSMLTGVLSDCLIVKNYMSLTNVRKFFTFVSAIGPGAFMIWAAHSGCDKMLVVVLFTIGMGFMGPFYSGFKANNLDLSPNYAGVLMGLSNGIAAATGMIGPWIVGIITTNRLMSEWQIVFWITFGIFAITTLIYLIWATGDTQPWNVPEIPNTIENGLQSPKHVETNNSDETNSTNEKEENVTKM